MGGSMCMHLLMCTSYMQTYVPIQCKMVCTCIFTHAYIINAYTYTVIWLGCTCISSVALCRSIQYELRYTAIYCTMTCVHVSLCMHEYECTHHVKVGMCVHSQFMHTDTCTHTYYVIVYGGYMCALASLVYLLWIYICIPAIHCNMVCACISKVYTCYTAMHSMFPHVSLAELIQHTLLCIQSPCKFLAVCSASVYQGRERRVRVPSAGL